MSRRQHAAAAEQSAENDSVQLLFALYDLRVALRRINQHARAEPSQPPDDTLREALEDANRALARAEARVPQQVSQKMSAVCPHCHGDGQITHRGVLLERLCCPRCGGSGRVTTLAKPPVPPRGRLQRLVLTRLLALGGASWPVPLKRLWAGQRLTAADRAGRSRAVRDLEDRGLLRRLHERDLNAALPVPRASQLRLTPEGIAMALLLTIQTQTLTKRPDLL